MTTRIYRGAIRVHRRIVTLVVLTTMSATLPQCSRTPPAQETTSAPPSVITTTRTTPTSPPLTTSTSPTPPPPTAYPVSADELGATWKPGCPVGPELLRNVEVNYVGFDGQTHRGELIVHRDVVADVIAIFEQLYQLRYPIAKMQSVARYPGAEDELSMEDNNTSAFNCRLLPSGGDWALHAYGRAIDVDRNRTEPGMRHAGDPAVRAFTDRGWRWGGDWRTPKDYQHFEHR